MRFAGFPKREKRQLALRGDHAQVKPLMQGTQGSGQTRLIEINSASPVVAGVNGDLIKASFSGGLVSFQLGTQNDLADGQLILAHADQVNCVLTGDSAGALNVSSSQLIAAGNTGFNYRGWNGGPFNVAATIHRFTGTASSASSGNTVWVSIQPSLNQSGTAAATDLQVNRTETGVGSGAQLLFDLQVAGASKFAVDNAGKVRTSNSAAGSTLGSVVKKFPIYDAAGTLLGYFPIYDTIT